MFVPWMSFGPGEPRGMWYRVQKNLPVEMEILRDEDLEIHETGFHQFLRNVLDCDI